MDNEEIVACKVGIAAASITSCVYAVIIVHVALATDALVFFALFGILPLFVLTYFLGFTLKMGMVKFLSPKQVYKTFDNPGDNFFKSEYEKRSDSLFWAVVCFVPLLVFYFLFSWIFYIVKK